MNETEVRPQLRLVHTVDSMTAIWERLTRELGDEKALVIMPDIGGVEVYEVSARAMRLLLQYMPGPDEDK